MRTYLKIIFGFVSIILASTFAGSPAKSYEISSDPTYVVINFSDSFHFLDWGAGEADWQNIVKPAAKKRLENLRNTLFYPRDTGNYILAWSTLLEYTNYPLDTPSDSSPYVVRLKRMLELAQEENFPIFVPLNGFQWWDELPELWNYWDSDGNQTPGCTNASHANCPFVRLRDETYRARFIAGFDPKNKWNVDWKDWTTPMKFVTRNWGGGDVYVAPPPNLVSSNQVKKSFASLQSDRYAALVQVLSDKVTSWESQGKGNLFAGMAIGTEVSLYQSLDPKAANMKSYGFRALQDRFCHPANPDCGQSQNWGTAELNQMRYQIMNEYFTTLGQITHAKGIPKERVYAHSWNEKNGTDNDQSFTNNFEAGITLYTRPAQSLYKLAIDPLAFDLIKNSLEGSGYPGWSGPEFAPMERTNEGWRQSFTGTFLSLHPPKLIDIYNETDILSTAAIPELKDLLNQPKILNEACRVESTILGDDGAVDPLELSWKPMDAGDNAVSQEFYLWPGGITPIKVDGATRKYQLDPSSLTQRLPKKLAPGKYYWAVKRVGCDGKRWTISDLQTFTIRSSKERSFKENVIYWYKNLNNKVTF